jgi:hypothetical protein
MGGTQELPENFVPFGARQSPLVPAGARWCPLVSVRTPESQRGCGHVTVEGRLTVFSWRGDCARPRRHRPPGGRVPPPPRPPRLRGGPGHHRPGGPAHPGRRPAIRSARRPRCGRDRRHCDLEGRVQDHPFDHRRQDRAAPAQPPARPGLAQRPSPTDRAASVRVAAWPARRRRVVSMRASTRALVRAKSARLRVPSAKASTNSSRRSSGSQSVLILHDAASLAGPASVNAAQASPSSLTWTTRTGHRWECSTSHYS